VGDELLQEMAGPLGRILVQLSGGGGATKLNIDAGACVRACLRRRAAVPGLCCGAALSTLADLVLTRDTAAFDAPTHARRRHAHTSPPRNSDG
jgi:hypothetical protein